LFGCHDCALGRFGAGLVPITTWPAGANRRDNCAPRGAIGSLGELRLGMRRSR
jgi:hypothetical protein